MDNIQDLLEDIELYEYFERNYVEDNGIFYICYPPQYQIPLKARNKDELFEKVIIIANDLRQNMMQEKLMDQLVSILGRGEENLE